MEDEQRQIFKAYLSLPKASEADRAAAKAELTTPFALQRMTAILLGVHSIIPNGDLKTPEQAEAFVLGHVDLCTRRSLTTDQAALTLCALDENEYMEIGRNNKAYRYFLTPNKMKAKLAKQVKDDPFPMTELRLRFINYNKKKLRWEAGDLLGDFVFPLTPESTENLALKGYEIMKIEPPEKRPTFVGVMDLEIKASKEERTTKPHQPTLFSCPNRDDAHLLPSGQKKRRVIKYIV